MGIVVVDVGATKTRAAWYENRDLETLKKTYVSDFTQRNRPQEEILQTIYGVIDRISQSRSPEGISVVIPGTYDDKSGKIISCGIVHNLDGCALSERIESRYGVPCIVNNDGNAFAVAEYHMGSKPNKCMIGIVLGTGFGSGHIIKGELHEGMNGSAGEYGRQWFKEEHGPTIDDMCSGRWFELKYGIKGEEMFTRARAGDAQALEAFEQFGRNLAQALLRPIYAYGPAELVIGGAGKDTYALYSPSMLFELSEIHKKPGKHFFMPSIRPGVLEHPNLVGAGIIYEQVKSQLKQKVIA